MSTEATRLADALDTPPFVPADLDAAVVLLRTLDAKDAEIARLRYALREALDLGEPVAWLVIRDDFKDRFTTCNPDAAKDYADGLHGGFFWNVTPTYLAPKAKP